MEKIEIAALGAVQGITEFLPVSSTAHLMIVSWLFAWPDAGLDTAVWLHAGTLIAIFACFRRDWLRLLRGVFRSLKNRSFDSPEAKMGAGLAVTVIPAVAGGLLFEDIVSGALRSPLAVAGGLFAGSIALFWADRKPGKTKRLSDLTVRDCVIFGLAQSFALAPGVSRAGASIAGGMFLGYTREDSAKFAFMMGVPAISAAIAHRIGTDGFALPQGFSDGGGTVVGIATAAVSGAVAMRFLINFARRGSYTPFVIYRTAVALAIIFVFLF